MTKEDLLQSAAALQAPPPEAVAEFTAKSEVLVLELNKMMTARQDLEALIGPGNREMMEQNHRNHALFMQSILKNYKPEILVETVLWVFRAYRSHGFQLTYWPAQLDNWLTLLKQNLSKQAFQAIRPFYDWMLVNQPRFTSLSDKMMEQAREERRPIR